jgi:hypothetical protein
MRRAVGAGGLTAGPSSAPGQVLRAAASTLFKATTLARLRFFVNSVIALNLCQRYPYPILAVLGCAGIFIGYQSPQKHRRPPVHWLAGHPARSRGGRGMPVTSRYFLANACIATPKLGGAGQHQRPGLQNNRPNCPVEENRYSSLTTRF